MVTILEKIKSLFKRREKSNRIIKEDNLKEIISKEKEKILDKFYPEFENFYIQLNELVEKLNESLERLKKEKVEIPDERTKKIVENSKNEFVEKMERFISSFNTNYERNLDKMIEYYGQVSNSWNITNLETTTSYKRMKDAYKNSRQVANVFKEIFNLLKKEARTINRITALNSKLNEILKTYKDLNWTNEKIEEFKCKIQKTEEKISKLKKEKEEIKQKIEDFEVSEEVNNLKELQKIKNKLEYREKELASTCVQLISQISRVLKKVAHTFSEKEYLVIKKYIESPFDALTSDKQLEINEILKKSKMLIENNEIEIKNKSKTLETLEKMIKEDILNRIRKEYEIDKKNLIEIDKKIKSLKIEEKRRSLNLQLETIKRSEKEMNEELERLKSKLDELKQLKETIKDQLEEKIKNYFGENTEIIFS